MPDALVNHPWVGSVWLADAYEHDGFVTGRVVDDVMFGTPIYGVETYPATCIRKWTPPREEA